MPYQYLTAVPKNEIVRRLQSIVGDDELLDQLETVRGQVVTAEDLRKATHSELIQIAEASPNFTEADARSLSEQYRYRGTKTLYIHTYPNHDQNKIEQTLHAAELDDLNETIQTTYNDLTTRSLAAKKYSSLILRGIDQFNAGGDNFWELIYSYVVEIQTTDPETESASWHPDLRYGFIWVNLTSPWLIISAKDDVITNLFSTALAQFFDTQIVRLPIPKDVEIAVESYEHIRRATHVDEFGIRRRTLHQKLYEFDDEVIELQQRDQNQIRASSGYNVTLDDTEFVLSYMREKGAISLSKLLPTSHLREFGTEKVSQIYGAILDMQAQSPGQIVQISVDRFLAGSRRDTKDAIQEVLTKLAEARQAEQNEIELEIDPLRLTSLTRYFSFSTEINCAECGEPQNIRCSQCEAEYFRVENDNVICRSCNTSIDPNAVQCLEGHENGIASLSEVVTLHPTNSMYSITEQVMVQASTMNFNRLEEGFSIHDNQLYIFGSRGAKTVYLMDDIPEFRDAISLTLTDKQATDLKQVLNDYKEKCKLISHDACEICVQNKQGNLCLMRLYGLYDHQYTPRPHYNGEFGDVAFNVTLDGRQETLIILLKSGKPTGNPVTKRHNIGRDIFSQIDDFWTDDRASIIGVAVPQRLEDGFRNRLHREAQRYNKKLIFFGTDELAKIVQFVSDRDGVAVNEL